MWPSDDSSSPSAQLDNHIVLWNEIQLEKSALRAIPPSPLLAAMAFFPILACSLPYSADCSSPPTSSRRALLCGRCILVDQSVYPRVYRICGPIILLPETRLFPHAKHAAVLQLFLFLACTLPRLAALLSGGRWIIIPFLEYHPILTISDLMRLTFPYMDHYYNLNYNTNILLSQCPEDFHIMSYLIRIILNPLPSTMFPSL